MKSFIYLVQGHSELITSLYYIKNRKNSDFLFLTYDKKIEDCLFFPNSTWASGRNFLLKKALEKQERYLYYIFMDDDVSFLRGDIGLWESEILKHKPAAAMPAFVLQKKSVLGIGLSYALKNTTLHLPYQICATGDPQLLALHRDIIYDSIALPYQTKYDSVSWYETSAIQQLLLWNLYGKYTLQFNKIYVGNETHRDYPKKINNIHKEWLLENLHVEMQNRLDYCVNPFIIENIKNLVATMLKYNRNIVTHITHLNTSSSTNNYKKQKTHSFFYSGKVTIKKLTTTILRYNRNFFVYISHLLSIIFLTITYSKRKSYSLSSKQVNTILKKESILMKQYLDKSALRKSVRHIK